MTFTFTPALHIVYHLSHHGRIAEGRKTEGRRKDRRKRQIEGEEKIIKKERNRRVKNSFTRTYCLSGLPGWLSGKESTFQCRRCGFHPWFRKILWKRKWQPTPVFLLGESHGQRSLVGYSPQDGERVGCDLATKQQQLVTLVNWTSEVISSAD